MDAISVLSEDHRRILGMLSELDSAGGTADATAARRRTLADLIRDTSVHETIEQEYFWPAVRGSVVDGTELAAHAVEQEKAARRALDQLSRTSPDEPGFGRLLHEFTGNLREHIEYEESRVWPQLVDGLSEGELARLGQKLQEARKLAPTHPHPHAPTEYHLMRTTGPAIAALDHLRDRRHKNHPDA